MLLAYCLRHKNALQIVAGVQGFEPQLTDPESAVLPLDDTPPSRSKRLYPRFCSMSVISLCRLGRRFLTCRLLTDLAVPAAMRANEVVITRESLATYALPPMSTPHTPCFPSVSAVT